MINYKSFEYKGQTIYYFVKDIELKESRGQEMASAYMVICDKNKNPKNCINVYDERIKILYAMPIDAERWYDDYLNKKIE